MRETRETSFFVGELENETVFPLKLLLFSALSSSATEPLPSSSPSSSSFRVRAIRTEKERERKKGYRFVQFSAGFARGQTSLLDFAECVPPCSYARTACDFWTPSRHARTYTRWMGRERVERTATATEATSAIAQLKKGQVCNKVCAACM